jgi:hypothetical protein
MIHESRANCVGLFRARSAFIVGYRTCQFLSAGLGRKQTAAHASCLSILSSCASPPKPTPPVLSGNNGALLLRWCISFLRLLLAEVGLFPDRPDTGAGVGSPPISGDAYAAVPPMRTPREWLAAGDPTGSVDAEMRIRLLRKML